MYLADVLRLLRQCRKSDNGIHGRPDIMGHIKEEAALGQGTLHGVDLLPLRELMLLPDQVLDVQHHTKARKDDKEENETLS